MLVVRRREGEKILIGAEIEVTVMEISPTRVKLGVVAPRAVPVIREETLAVADDNRRAAQFVREGGLAGVLRILGKN